MKRCPLRVLVISHDICVCVQYLNKRIKYITTDKLFNGTYIKICWVVCLHCWIKPDPQSLIVLINNNVFFLSKLQLGEYLVMNIQSY